MEDILEPKELVALIIRAQALIREMGHRYHAGDRRGITPMCAVVLSMYNDGRKVKRLARKARFRETGLFLYGDEENLRYFEEKVRKSLNRTIGKSTIPNQPDILGSLVARLKKA